MSVYADAEDRSSVAPCTSLAVRLQTGPVGCQLCRGDGTYESFLKWDFIGSSRTEWPQGGMRPASLRPQLVECYPLAREGRFWETGTKAITNLYHNV